MKLDVVYNKSCQRMTELPDESIDMGMTSPPYWGLRDYGEDVKEIWGGDKDCEHEFQMERTPRPNASGGKNNPFAEKLKIKGVENYSEFADYHDRATYSEFCSICGAWHGQLGLEPTFQLYLDHMMIVCAEIKRVLKKTGSFWLNMGDTYGGSWQSYGNRPEESGIVGTQREKKTEHFIRGDSVKKFPATAKARSKCLLGIPWRLVLRLIDEQGWILRNAIIWHKPNAMPSSVKDRCSNSYEFLFHLVKAKKYYYDLDGIRQAYTKPLDRWGGDKLVAKGKATWDEGTGQNTYRDRDMRPNKAGKNPGDCWTIPTQPRPEAHFATFPDKLCIKPILATCPAEICRKCGKARVRITKTDYIPRGNPQKAHQQPKAETETPQSGGPGKGRPQGMRFGEANAIRQTTGWTDCGCNAGWDSGILLDPFAGRGTALIMAKKLGRHYVGYELKKEYWQMAERELAEIDPLFRRR